ncbi:uncharacterized protein DDB_G0271670 [Culicoides brevitarsis]|uniref:uncharacterized protein DDB_G0271670 n=1 Tax=Culicoides brevitarsis TaxID=469753 RepID=UPI00307B9E23
MLSVQSPGCAGMEWLGVPSRTTIATSTTRDERSRRRRDNNETSSSSSSSSSSSITTKANQYNHYPYSNTSSNSSSVGGMTPQICPNSNSNTKSSSIANQYPHHVQLPDGEYGDDRHLQIRTPSQQSEILRTYPRVPPNRTVQNVPDQLNYRRPNSKSTANIHENFGSGKSLVSSSNSTPVSKNEKKYCSSNSKFFGIFSFNRGSASKTTDLSSIGPAVSLSASSSSSQRNINNNNHSSNNNNTAASSEGATSSHLLNLTPLPVPVVRNHPSSDHLTVNNYTSSSSMSSPNHHSNKPISCPASPSSPSQQQAANEDDDARKREQRLTPTSSDKILSSSLESPKSSKYM